MHLKDRFKPFLKPTMLLSFAIAWMLTNGWAYVLLGIGIWGNVTWAYTVGAGYLALLWMPFTPEKLITIPLALAIQKILFNVGGTK